MSMKRLIARLEEGFGSPYKPESTRQVYRRHLDKIAEKVDASLKFKGNIATLTVDGPREAKDAIDRMKALGLWEVGLISKKMDLLKAASGMGGGGPIDFVFDLDLLDGSVDESEGTSDANHSFANKGPRPGPSQEEIAAMVEKIAEKVGAEVKKDKYEITFTVDTMKAAEANALINKGKIGQYKLGKYITAMKSKRNDDGTRVMMLTFGRVY